MTDTHTGLSWAAIGLMGSTGALMGVATTFVGIPPSVLPWCWLGLYIVWIAVVVRAASSRPLPTLVLGSLLSGALTGACQSAFLSRFRAANPWWSTEMNGIADGDLIGSLLVQGLGAGLVFGLVAGVIAWAVSRRYAPATATA